MSGVCAVFALKNGLGQYLHENWIPSSTVGCFYATKLCETFTVNQHRHRIYSTPNLFGLAICWSQSRRQSKRIRLSTAHHHHIHESEYYTYIRAPKWITCPDVLTSWRWCREYVLCASRKFPARLHKQSLALTYARLCIQKFRTQLLLPPTTEIHKFINLLPPFRG